MLKCPFWLVTHWIFLKGLSNSRFTQFLWWLSCWFVFFSHLLLEFSMRLGHFSYFSIDMGWSIISCMLLFMRAYAWNCCFKQVFSLKEMDHQQHKRAGQAFDFPLDNQSWKKFGRLRKSWWEFLYRYNYWLNHDTAERDEATRKGSLAYLNKSEKQKSKRQKSKWISWA